MEQRSERREKREKESVAAAAHEVLKALGSKAADAAQELRTALKDERPAPPRLVHQIHDALLEGLMDKRVKSFALERKKLFGISLGAEVPAKPQMRALVKRFEMTFMRPVRRSSAADPAR
jgi:hypothetical protein